MRWIPGLSFIAMAIWILIPDRLEDDKDAIPRFGVFGTTLIAFFLLEMGDKTQIATVVLAVKYSSLLGVVMVAYTRCNSDYLKAGPAVFAIALASNWSVSPGSPVRTIPMSISACW